MDLDTVTVPIPGRRRDRPPDGSEAIVFAGRPESSWRPRNISDAASTNSDCFRLSHRPEVGMRARRRSPRTEQGGHEPVPLHGISGSTLPGGLDAHHRKRGRWRGSVGASGWWRGMVLLGRSWRREPRSARPSFAPGDYPRATPGIGCRDNPRLLPSPARRPSRDATAANDRAAIGGPAARCAPPTAPPPRPARPAPAGRPPERGGRSAAPRAAGRRRRCTAAARSRVSP